MLDNFFSISTVASVSSCIKDNGVSPVPLSMLHVVCFDSQKGQCTRLQLSLAPRAVLAVPYWCILCDTYVLLFSLGETSLSIKWKWLNTFYWDFTQTVPQDWMKVTEIGRLTGIQQEHYYSNALAGFNDYNFTTLSKEITEDTVGWISPSCICCLLQSLWDGTWWMWAFLCN